MTKRHLHGQVCAVLGGSGFLGVHLCRRLLEDGATVRSFGRTERHATPGVAWFPGNFSDPSAVAAAIEGVDIVYHLVSTSTPSSAEADRLHDLQSNAGCTISLLDQCLKYKIDRVVFASSGGTVYGSADRPPFSERTLPRPISAYGVTKLTIEHYLAQYNHLYAMRNISLRISNPFGPLQFGGRHQGVIGIFMRKAIEGKPIEIWGDGSVVRDYIYVTDVAEAFVKAGHYEGNQQVFNIGRGEGRSLHQLVSDIERLSGKPIELKLFPGRPFDIPVSLLDTSVAQEQLGWRAGVDWQTGLKSTFDWMKNSLG